MDFDEIENQSHATNARKNRVTMVALFIVFIAPVVIAYTAYFNGWFAVASKNHGELLSQDNILDIEDFKFVRSNGEVISGKDFETLYWWVLPIDPQSCDEECLKLNTYTLNQTYVGLGKETKKLQPLLVLPQGTEANVGEFPTAHSQFSAIGVKALTKTRSGLDKDLPANFIYLVDPLGNIFMRYPLVSDKKQAPLTSKDLREDIKRLFKYSRLG